MLESRRFSNHSFIRNIAYLKHLKCIQFQWIHDKNDDAQAHTRFLAENSMHTERTLNRENVIAHTKHRYYAYNVNEC